MMKRVVTAAVVLLGARAHVEGAVVEFDLQVFLQLDDLGMVQVFNSATNKVRHNRLCAAPGNPGTRLFTDRCGEFETSSDPQWTMLNPAL